MPRIRRCRTSKGVLGLEMTQGNSLGNQPTWQVSLCYTGRLSQRLTRRLSSPFRVIDLFGIDTVPRKPNSPTNRSIRSPLYGGFSTQVIAIFSLVKVPMSDRSAETLFFFTHHKCATKWLGDYLYHTGVANRLNYQSTHFSRLLPEGDIILLTNSSYPFVKEKNIGGCHIVRNPMSIIASAYFSHLKTHSLDDWEALALQRNLLSTEDRVAGLFLTLTFLERADFGEGSIGPLYGLRIWDYADPRFLTIRMEDAIGDPEASIKSALSFVGYSGVEKFPPKSQYAFQNFSGGRAIGMIDEGSHYRSGDPDDWKRHLPRPIVHYVQTHFEALLAKYYPETLHF